MGSDFEICCRLSVIGYRLSVAVGLPGLDQEKISANAPAVDIGKSIVARIDLALELPAYIDIAATVGRYGAGVLRNPPTARKGVHTDYRASMHVETGVVQIRPFIVHSWKGKIAPGDAIIATGQ